jgi:hypothetical protein
MAQDERPVEITANAICCGVVCQFATFHGDDPELAAPVLERAGRAWVCRQPALTCQCRVRRCSAPPCSSAPRAGDRAGAWPASVSRRHPLRGRGSLPGAPRPNPNRLIQKTKGLNRESGTYCVVLITAVDAGRLVGIGAAGQMLCRRPRRLFY